MFVSSIEIYIQWLRQQKVIHKTHRNIKPYQHSATYKHLNINEDQEGWAMK